MLYRVIYEDGDTEEYTIKGLVQIVLSPEMAKIGIGSRVAVLWPNDGVYYKATVTRERNERKPFCLEYDTGEYEWVNLCRRKFRILERETQSRNDVVSPLETKCKQSNIDCSRKRYAIETKVESFFEGSGWWKGEVTAYKGQRYRVLYEDGEIEECTEKELAAIVITPELAQVDVGSRLALKWPYDDKYYEATVTCERKHQQRYCVEYDSGEYEWVDLHQRKFRLVDAQTHRRKDEVVEDDSESDDDYDSE